MWQKCNNQNSEDAPVDKRTISVSEKLIRDNGYLESVSFRQTMALLQSSQLHTHNYHTVKSTLLIIF